MSNYGKRFVLGGSDQGKEVFSPFEYQPGIEIATLVSSEDPTCVTHSRENVHCKLSEMRHAFSNLLTQYYHALDQNPLKEGKDARSTSTLIVQRKGKVLTIVTNLFDRTLNEKVNELMDMNREVLVATKAELNMTRKNLLGQVGKLKKQCQSLKDVKDHIDDIFDDQNDFITKILDVVQKDELTFGIHVAEFEDIRSMLTFSDCPTMSQDASILNQVQAIEACFSEESINRRLKDIERKIDDNHEDFELGVLNIKETIKDWKPVVLKTWENKENFAKLVARTANAVIDQVKELDSFYQNWQREIAEYKAVLCAASSRLQDVIDSQNSQVLGIKNRMKQQEEIIFDITSLFADLETKAIEKLGKIAENRKINFEQ